MMPWLLRGGKSAGSEQPLFCHRSVISLHSSKDSLAQMGVTYAVLCGAASPLHLPDPLGEEAEWKGQVWARSVLTEESSTFACPTLNFHVLEWVIAILDEKQREMARNYSGWVSNTLRRKWYKENLWGIADWGFCTAQLPQSLSPK